MTFPSINAEATGRYREILFFASVNSEGFSVGGLEKH